MYCSRKKKICVDAKSAQIKLMYTQTKRNKTNLVDTVFFRAALIFVFEYLSLIMLLSNCEIPLASAY